MSIFKRFLAHHYCTSLTLDTFIERQICWKLKERNTSYCDIWSISLLSTVQDCQPIKDLPDTDAVQTVGGWEDWLPGWPSGEICGELYHQKPAWEDPRLPAEVRDRRPDFPGQRRGSDSLLIRHPAQDGQSALRYIQGSGTPVSTSSWASLCLEWEVKMKIHSRY